ncbi:MAG TPA: hypothetical protein VIM02_04370 [Rhizomicrobium sp.]
MVDVFVANADDAPSFRAKIGVAAPIMLKLFFAAMRGAIDFHDKLALENCEIRNVRPDRMLAAKVVTDRAKRAQVYP